MRGQQTPQEWLAAMDVGALADAIAERVDGGQEPRRAVDDVLARQVPPEIVAALDVESFAAAVTERLGEPAEPYTVKQLAERFAISERTVRRMLAKGEIPSHIAEGRRRIRRTDVEDYLEDCRAREQRTREDRARKDRAATAPARSCSQRRARQPRPRARRSRPARRRARAPVGADRDGEPGEPPLDGARLPRGWGA